MSKNYYAILGVTPTATSEEIRSAYRRRAKQYHPDHFGQNSAPFLNVQEAYDVLSDPAYRASHDHRWRNTEGRGIFSSPPGPEIFRSRKPTVEPLRSSPRRAETISPLRSFRSVHPSIDEISDYLHHAFGIQTLRKAERPQLLTMEVVLTPDQARQGGRLLMLMPLESACPSCAGSGTTGLWQCWRCDGTGDIREEVPLEMKFPPGIRDHYQVAIPLDCFGIHEICPIIVFRVSPEGDFEVL